MKKLLFILFSIVLISSCSKDEMTLENNNQAITETIYNEKADEIRCPLVINQIGTDESGCCIYEVTFTPRQRGTYTLHGGGGIINAQVTLKGTYKWTITTCEDLEICLIYTDWKNQISRRICCETLTCDVIVDCNIDVTIEDTGVDKAGKCVIKICVDQVIDPAKSLSCEYSLFIDGVDQGAPFKCCWTIKVPGGETVVIEIRNSQGQICYTNEYTCDYNCCDDLDYQTCLYDIGSPDCRIFFVELNSDVCPGNYTVKHLGYKKGTATVINPANGLIEVCVDQSTVGHTVGISVTFETQNCGDFTTGFFYPWDEYDAGTIEECF